MEEKEKFKLLIERWGKTRKMNKWKYYFIYGSLLWGGLTFVILTIWDIVRSEFEFKYVVLRFFLFLVIGLLFGKLQWKSKENFYQKYKDL